MIQYVTELIDADSIGINAILTSIIMDIGIEFILSTEASSKTRGSISEIRKAIFMNLLAKLLNKPPKDLSENLLVIKKKYNTS